jgi:hypothetical protein
MRILKLLSFVLAVSFMASVAAKADEIKINSVEVEKKGRQSFFRVELSWPNEGIPSYYPQFVYKKHSKLHRHDWHWPVDALALIPQDNKAKLVYRVDNNLEAIQVFVGQLEKKQPVYFLFRRPTKEGDYQYDKVRVDFKKAKQAKNLKKIWLKAQADFFGTYQAPVDQSFFAYAEMNTRLRLEPKKKPQNRRARPAGMLDSPYEIASGALALQESMQLDRMRQTRLDKGKRKHDIKKISGITVKGHPWKKMIGDKSPAIEPIAALIPDDQYYIRFKTSKKLKDFLQLMHDWGGSLLSQIETGGRDYQTKAKIEEQICIKSTWLSDLLGPAVIDSLAITGSDPYLREGSDFSIVFKLKSPAVFKMAVARFIDEAKKKYPKLKQTSTSYKKVTIENYATLDHQVRCYRALLDDQYYVYSNNPTAIRRIIDRYQTKKGTLAKSLDFVYMRKLYPLDQKEDGFIFLSDAWLRFLSSPFLRINEKRRLEAVTTMQMVKNAALLYLWENPGAKTPNLNTLYKKKYLDKKLLLLEPGDKILWNPETIEVATKKYGRLGYLTHNLDMPIKKVTDIEKQEYERFRNRYQDRWRRYFDPIGIRINVDKRVDLEVTVLPLIDNSEYNDLKENFGGQAIALEPQLRDGPVVFHYATHINPENQDLKRFQRTGSNLIDPSGQASFDWIGERLEFWIEDVDNLQKIIEEERIDQLAKIPMVFGVEIKSTFGFAAFLVAIQAWVRTSAPNMIVFEPQKPYREYAFTAIKPAPKGPAARELAELAIYYGSVGDMFYLSTSLDALKKIVDGQLDQQGKKSGYLEYKAGKKGHMAIRLNPSLALKLGKLFDFVLLQEALKAERQHLKNLWLLAKTVGLEKSESVLGYRIESALGNQFSYDEKHDEIVGSTSGSLWNYTNLTQLPNAAPLKILLNSIAWLRASMEFTPEGLQTALSIRRN